MIIMNKDITLEDLEILEEFDKRRTYKEISSLCYNYSCPVFLNCLSEINQLKQQLKDKDKVIDEVIKIIKKEYFVEYNGKLVKRFLFDTPYKILEILEGSKNVNSK